MEAFELGQALRRRRTMARMTQAEVAAAMGTSQAAISRAEVDRVMPTVGFLERYAWATSRLVSLDLGPPARQRGVRWTTKKPGVPAPAGHEVEEEARLRQRLVDLRRRVDRGELEVSDYAMQKLETEFELAAALRGTP